MKSAGASWLLVLASVTGWGQCQELDGAGGSLVRATDLKAEPYTDARVLAVLAENLRVTVLSRSAGWLQVHAGDNSGWVKMFSVRWDSQASGPSGDTDGVRKLFNLATTGSSGSTVTTASRGLDEAKLLHPSPDPAALKVMQAYSVPASVARAFADEQGLKAQPLAYVKVVGGKS
jgi:hypothetical protein